MYRIKNWNIWQSYRKDRGQPPWIKLHRCLMRNPEWVAMTDAERGQLVGMWLLAADKDGILPDKTVIRKMCFFTSNFNINRFMDLGFIEKSGVSVASGGSQDVQPEKNRDREEKSRVDTDTMVPYEDVLFDFNEVMGTHYKPQTKEIRALISARWQDGATLEDFKVVHRRMHSEWATDEKMCKFLRPQTLYTGKFSSYLNRMDKKKTKTEEIMERYG